MTDFSMVLECSVSYRRNIKDMPFVKTLTDNELAVGVSRTMSEIFGDEFEFKSLRNIPLVTCQKLRESGVLSEGLIDNKDISAFGVNEDRTKYIFINEQDHIRLIAKDKGFNLEKCFSLANQMDDMLLEKLEMAFNNDYGYLTSNPCFMGTGMEISVMLFLPALTKSNKLGVIVNELLKNEFELNFYGVNGENSNCPFVIIKNKFTFGYKESEYAVKMQDIITRICELETNEENNIFDLSASALVDGIYRDYGIAGSCYRISFSESLEKIGNILWGIRLKMLKCKKQKSVFDFNYELRDFHLGNDLGVKEAEKLRAKMLNQFVLENISKGEVDV